MPRFRIEPKLAVCVVFVAALFMSIMDTTIVNVALPTLHRQFTASSAAVNAVVTAYLISLAVSIPASGWVGDRWGTKRTFLSALVIFSVASALCGFASSLTTLIGARIFQGIAAGMLTPVGTAMLFRTFPPAERVRVTRILIIPTVIAPAVGPVLGGWLVDQFSWRWVFFVNVPIGLAAFLFGLIWLREHREPTAGRFDVAGFLLAGIGFGFLMYALTEGAAGGWTSPGILGAAVVGLLALAALIVVELRSAEPMIDLRLMSNRLFRIANLVSLFSSAGFLGVLFLVPLFLQEVLKVSAFTSGLTTFPEAIGVVLSSQIVARLYPRIGPRRLMVGGLLGVTITLTLLSLIGLATNLWIIRVLMFFTGAGMAYVFLSGQTAAFANIPSAATGRASALYNAQNQLGSALGVALLSTVLAMIGTTRIAANGVVQPNLAAYHAAFLAAAALALIGALISLAISDRDAEATMRSGKYYAIGEAMPIDEAMTIAE